MRFAAEEGQVLTSKGIISRELAALQACGATDANQPLHQPPLPILMSCGDDFYSTILNSYAERMWYTLACITSSLDRVLEYLCIYHTASTRNDLSHRLSELTSQRASL
jgi:hypothetical protein